MQITKNGKMWALTTFIVIQFISLEYKLSLKSLKPKMYVNNNIKAKNFKDSIV